MLSFVFLTLYSSQFLQKQRSTQGISINREIAKTCFFVHWGHALHIGETSRGYRKLTLRILGYLILGIRSPPVEIKRNGWKTFPLLRTHCNLMKLWYEITKIYQRTAINVWQQEHFHGVQECVTPYSVGSAFPFSGKSWGLTLKL